jgi:glycine cleavage system H protein
MSDPLHLRFPPDRLYAPEQDMWVLPQADGTVRVGATHWVAAHGHFMYFTPRPAGTVVERDRSLGVMETAKTVVAIHSPVSGRIVEVNDAVVGNVQPIERDPYGEGWMFRLAPSRWEAEKPGLLDGAAYAAWLTQRTDDGQGEKPGDARMDDLGIDPNRGY